MLFAGDLKKESLEEILHTKGLQLESLIETALTGGKPPVRKKYETCKLFCDGAISKKGERAVGGIGGVCLHELRNGNVEVLFCFKRSIVEEDITSQSLELSAVRKALKSLLARITIPHRELTAVKKIEIVTDSAYAVGGIKTHLAKWRKNGWKTTLGTDVKNRQCWEDIAFMMDEVKSLEITLSIQHCPGHAGVVGNELADSLATMAVAEELEKTLQRPVKVKEKKVTNKKADAVAAAGNASTPKPFRLKRNYEG